MNKIRSIIAIMSVVSLPVLALAQEADPGEALITRVQGVSTTASTVFMAIAGLSVTAFIVKTVISFARKGK